MDEKCDRIEKMVLEGVVKRVDEKLEGGGKRKDRYMERNTE